MNGEIGAVAWYRFRGTFGRRWGGYLTVVLLVGLIGGLSLGAVVTARRTQSSPTDLAALTRSSDLFTRPDVFNPSIGSNAGYDQTVADAIAHLPHVTRARSLVELSIAPLRPSGVPNTSLPMGIGMDGSVDGLGFTQDRVLVTRGRMANPAAHEFVMDSASARAFGYRLGQVVEFGAVPNVETLSPDFLTAVVPPDMRFSAKLVGLGAVRAGDLVQDDVDSAGAQLVLFTPAITRPLTACCAIDAEMGLQLDHGSSDEVRVGTEVARVLPKGIPAIFALRSTATAKAERAIQPEAIAIAVFGGIAALAMLLIAGQAISRQLRQGEDDDAVMRALGASPTMTLTEGLIGIIGAVVIGALLAAAVAVGLSPLAPIGPLRPYLPVGLHADLTVIGSGLLVFAVTLSAFAIGAAFRGTPHRVAKRRQQTSARRSAVSRVAASGLPLPATTGIRFALEPGTGRNTVPVRSAIAGAALAMVVVTATVTFGASLRTLVSHPVLYGWNWDYELNGGGGLGDLPEKQAATLLDRDHDVAAWAGVYFTTLQIDGQNVAVIGGSPHATVGPPVLSGHGFDAPDQVVLGSVTLAQLHKRVGDTVEVRARSGPSTTLRVVGTATMPSIGSGGVHTEMGTGALLSFSLIPPESRNTFDLPVPGPNAILVRMRRGVTPARAARSLQAIMDSLQVQGNGATVDSVQRPAEIINYRSLGAIPGLLGAGLAAGALVALGLTLVASVRRRRRDLALLKTLGFTRRQLATTVAWQSTIAIGIGTIVGVPLGLIFGRVLWGLFVREIHAVPQPTVPTLSIALIAVGGLVLANVVAAVPGRIAARTPTALLLRAE